MIIGSIDVTPECETGMKELADQLFNKFYTGFHIQMQKAVRDASSGIRQTTTEAKSQISDIMRTESEKAASRIRYSSTGTILSAPSAWILSTLLIMSLALNIVIATFNAQLWHLPTLTYIVYVIAGATLLIFGIILGYFHLQFKIH